MCEERYFSSVPFCRTAFPNSILVSICYLLGILNIMLVPIYHPDLILSFGKHLTYVKVVLLTIFEFEAGIVAKV